MVPRESRYSWVVWDAADTVSSLLIMPFQHLTSITLSCYCPTTFDNPSMFFLFLRFAVLGPIFAFLSLVATPLAIAGFLLWVMINHYAHDIQPFRTTQPEQSSKKEPHNCHISFTFCTSNVILCPEFIVRYNNNRNVYWRVNEVARRLLHQDPQLNLTRNLAYSTRRDHIIQTKLPVVDILLLQEVCERHHAYRLLKHFSQNYPYCIYDVGSHKLSVNNCLMASGLFLASRYPILDAAFHPYSRVSHYGILISLGVLMAKVDLGVINGPEGEELRAVGYVANTHTQAYQGKERILVAQLEEMQSVFNKYIIETHSKHKEVLVFAVTGGDFNCDNISPGDQPTRELPLFNEYEDPCREKAGQDKTWAIGTELRQRRLALLPMRDPATFRTVLLDDLERRNFVLDADVEEQSTNLMYCDPKPDPHTGKLRPVVGGGGRRIDYLLLRVGDQTRPVSYWFSSAMASLSDHIPVAMMVERKVESQEEERS